MHIAYIGVGVKFQHFKLAGTKFYMWTKKLIGFNIKAS